MRANGGFVGSYAKISINTKQYKYEVIPQPQIDLDFQDIYVPNGQVTDYVPPPLPIQQAFGKGSWELANADWDPDFTVSSKALRWFFEKGKEKNPDIMVFLNLSTIKKLLTVVGPFTVPDYQSTITPENLYLFLQGQAEVNFFPGSTQKKDALYAVGHALYKKTRSLSLSQKLQLISIIYTDLRNKNIVVNSTNTAFQNLLQEKDFAGTYVSPSLDTFGLVETNLGANKANAFVSRQTIHEISSQNNFFHHQVSLHFYNSSPSENPNPPFHYGGNYIVYLRFYLPQISQNIRIASDGQELYPLATSSSLLVKESTPSSTPNISTHGTFTEIGFFNPVRAGASSDIVLSYDTPILYPYSFTILKQHGLVSSPTKFIFQGKNHYTDLSSDFHFAQKTPPN